MTAVGIFGGTFDPVHIGHLRTCVELRQHLDLSAVHLVPCATPPHRGQPFASARQRLAMLRAAIVDEPGLQADDRELHRQGPSYTIDTLAELRAEIGEKVPLLLCVGMDSLVHLDSWHCWQELTDIAHLVVVARPGWQRPTAGNVARWLADKLTDAGERLQEVPCGRVLIRDMTLLPISSSALRGELQAGRSVRYLVPDAVLQYIDQHRLYRRDGS